MRRINWAVIWSNGLVLATVLCVALNCYFTYTLWQDNLKLTAQIDYLEDLRHENVLQIGHALWVLDELFDLDPELPKKRKHIPIGEINHLFQYAGEMRLRFEMLYRANAWHAALPEVRVDPNMEEHIVPPKLHQQ